MEMMDTFYLVNVVHNDFHNRDAIFEPFFKVGAQAQVAASTESKIQANGHTFDQLANGVQAITISSTA
jgi:hypothetical protein